jgi:hypothetical protein
VERQSWSRPPDGVRALSAVALKSLIVQAMRHNAHPRLSEPTDGVVEDAAQIEQLTKMDVASAVRLVVRVHRVRPGGRREQFASDITDDRRQMFVAKVSGQVVAYGRVTELAADEAGPETRLVTISAAFWWNRRCDAGVSPLR